MKRKIFRIIIVFLVVIIFYAVFVITAKKYKRNHIMVYRPNTSEEALLAEEFGIIMIDGLRIDEVLLDYSYPNKDSAYAIRITGVDDEYSFLTRNINLNGDVSVDNGTTIVNGVPLIMDQCVFNYERTAEYEGCSVTVLIWGGHNYNNNNLPYEYPVTFTFFYNAGELSFIECSCKTTPFGNDCYDRIVRDEYWRDYWLYPIRPLI